MQLYLIRHAQSSNNAQPEHQRVEDPGITEVGRQQAERLAAWTRTLEIDTLITSPFLRTLQTTASMLQVSPRHVHVWHDLFERGGCFRGHGPQATEGGPGLGRSEIAGRLNSQEGNGCSIDESIGEQGWWFGKDRETDGEAAARARAVKDRLIRTFGSDGRVVVAVIHADLKRLLLTEMLEPRMDVARFGLLRNTGISKLNYDGLDWSLDWFNSVSHLPAELIGAGEG